MVNISAARVIKEHLDVHLQKYYLAHKNLSPNAIDCSLVNSRWGSSSNKT